MLLACLLIVFAADRCYFPRISVEQAMLLLPQLLVQLTDVLQTDAIVGQVDKSRN